MTSKSWGDLKKQADDASRPVPKDQYDVVVTKAELTTASTGSLMIKSQMKIVGGPYNNRTLFTNFVLSTENSIALSIFFKNMAAFGLDDAFFGSLAGPDSDPEVGMQTVAVTLVGRTARADVSIRTWQGQDRNEVGQFVKSTNQLVGLSTGPTMTVNGATSAPVPNIGSVSAAAGASTPPVPSIPQNTAPSHVAPQVASPVSYATSAPPEIPAF